MNHIYIWRTPDGIAHTPGYAQCLGIPALQYAEQMDIDSWLSHLRSENMTVKIYISPI